MKQKIAVLAVVLAITVNMGAAAQGYPVIDITNIIAAIENGYTLVQQLQTMYNTLKTSYDQLQKQIKSFESFDFNSLDARDPLKSWGSLVTYADRMMTYEENIEAIIKKKDIKINGGSYSLVDIFKSPATHVENIVTGGVNYLLDPFETKLSPEEKAVFHQKYGMSYGNYMRLNQMREMLQKKAAEVFAYSGSLQKDLADDRERLSAIVADMKDNESIVQQQQINNAVLAIMAQDIKTQSNLLGDIAAQLATAEAQAQAEKQAIKDELNMNSLGISEGFLKMFEDMPPESAYR
jgi:conjugal transfer/entry exclusion protein